MGTAASIHPLPRTVGILSPMCSAVSCHPGGGPLGFASSWSGSCLPLHPDTAPGILRRCLPHPPYLPALPPPLSKRQRGGRDLVPGVPLAPLKAHSQHVCGSQTPAPSQVALSSPGDSPVLPPSYVARDLCTSPNPLVGHHHVRSPNDPRVLPGVFHTASHP